MDPYYRDTVQYSPSYVTQAETVQYVPNEWYTEPQYLHDTHVPQNSPITSPQDWQSTNGQEAVINQGMNYYGNDNQIQDEWLPECQVQWVPVEQSLNTQQVPVPCFGYFNHQMPYAEHPYEAEWTTSEMQPLQAPVQIINGNEPGSYQPNGLWIPVANSEVPLPCAPYHVQPNHHYNNYGTPYGPEMQVPQYQYTSPVPSFDGQFDYVDYGVVNQQDTFEQQTETLSFEASQEQYHKEADHPHCHMQARVTEAIEASILQEQQQQYLVNYVVQPDQNNYQQQQQPIVYQEQQYPVNFVQPDQNNYQQQQQQVVYQQQQYPVNYVQPDQNNYQQQQQQIVHQQQQYPVNYAQPDENNYQQQQQQIVYLITSGHPGQSEMTSQQYETYTDASAVGQYDQQCDTVSNPPCYPHYEEPQILVANETISHQFSGHPYYPYAQDGQCYMPSNNATVPNQCQHVFQSVYYLPPNDIPHTYTPHETAINGQCNQQCEVHFSAPQFYGEGVQQSTFASHEIMIQQYYTVHGTCSGQEIQVQLLQPNTVSIQNYYHQQNNMEYIPPHGHISPGQAKFVSDDEGQNIQYVNMYENYFDPNVREQYVFVSNCGQYEEMYREYGQFCEQGQMLTTIVPQGIPTQQYCIAFDSQCNGQTEAVNSEEQKWNEHQMQNENNSLPHPCSSTTSDHQHTSPRYQFKSQEEHTVVDSSCDPFAGNQQPNFETEANLQDQYQEEKQQVLNLSSEHNPAKKIQETSSSEAAGSGVEKPNINDITFMEETPESSDSKQESLDLNPPPSMTKESKMINGVSYVADIEKGIHDR